MNLLQIIEKKEIKNINFNIIKNFNSGDVLSVDSYIDLKNKKKIQNFTGIVISKKNKNINSSFILRKVSQNIWVEKTFQTYSPLIKNIKIKFKNNIKKSKLYYLRKNL